MTRLSIRTTPLLAVRRSRPVFVLPLAATLFLLFGFGPDYQFALLACGVLVVGFFLLWRPGEAQILLFLFLFQWLQLATTVFYADLRGVTLADFMAQYPGVEYATTLALIGLLSLAVGIRVGAGPQKPLYLSMIRESIRKIPPSRWLKVHLATWAASVFCLTLARTVPAVSQPLLALGNIKWGTFLIFTVVTFARRDGPRLIWLVLFCAEFVLSLGGYFSTFKDVFIYTLIAITAVASQLTFKQIASGAVVAATTLVVGLYWTAVKPEYRRFLSGGQATQAVVVGYDEAVKKLVELVQQVDSTKLEKAAGDLAERFSEIDMFSAVVVYVPSVRAHEDGKLWLDAISRPFMPRMFFPRKAVIDESAMTNYYTGLGVAGSAQGTQISMGYIADSYIDFGKYGMMVAIFLFGCFIGYAYRWLVNDRNGIGLIGCGLASSTFVQFTSIGSSSAKLVGGIIVCLLVAYLILRFVMPRYLPMLFAQA